MWGGIYAYIVFTHSKCLHIQCGSNPCSFITDRSVCSTKELKDLLNSDGVTHRQSSLFDRIQSSAVSDHFVTCSKNAPKLISENRKNIQGVTSPPGDNFIISLNSVSICLCLCLSVPLSLSLSLSLSVSLAVSPPPPPH